MSHASTTIFTPSQNSPSRTIVLRATAKITKAIIPRIIEEKAQRNRQAATKMVSRRMTENNNVFNDILIKEPPCRQGFLVYSKIIAHKDAEVHFAVPHRNIRSITGCRKAQ